jgi:hypothetical protein
MNASSWQEISGICIRNYQIRITEPKLYIILFLLWKLQYLLSFQSWNVHLGFIIQLDFHFRFINETLFRVKIFFVVEYT